MKIENEEVYTKKATLNECAAYFNYEWNDSGTYNSLENCRALLHCYNEIGDTITIS